MGQALFLTGRGKLENFPRTVEFFTGPGLPMPELNAAFVYFRVDRESNR